MSNFKTDLNVQEEFNKFLDKYFYPKIQCSYERKTDKTSQLKGIDLILNKNNTSYKADEKSAIYYLNQPLTTFALELSYLKYNKQKIGWFLNEEIETELYILIWPNVSTKKYNELDDKKNKEKKKNWIASISFEDFENAEIYFLLKKDLIFHLNKEGLSTDFLLEFNNDLRVGKKKSEEIYKEKKFKFSYSEQLSEKPINLLIYKEFLKKIAIEKYNVSKHGVQFL